MPRRSPTRRRWAGMSITAVNVRRLSGSACAGEKRSPSVRGSPRRPAQRIRSVVKAPMSRLFGSTAAARAVVLVRHGSGCPIRKLAPRLSACGGAEVEDLHTICTHSAWLLRKRELRCFVTALRSRRGNLWHGPAAACRFVLSGGQLRLSALTGGTLGGGQCLLTTPLYPSPCKT